MTPDDRPEPAVDDALVQESADDLYEHAPCGYLSTAPDGLIVKVNQTFLAWTGYEREDLLSRRHFADLLRPGGKIYYETHMAPLLQMQGAANEIALDLVRKDGQPLPTLVSALARRDASGRPLVLRMTIFNATERRRYEGELLRAKQAAEQAARALQQSEAAVAAERDRLRQIVAVLPEALLLAAVGDPPRVVLGNAAAEAIFGADLTGRPVPLMDGKGWAPFNLRDADGMPHPPHALPLERALREGEVVRGDRLLVRNARDGRDVPILINAAPLRDADGTITGAIAVFQDITALVELERTRDAFLSSAAHDLKTPLTSIRGYAQLARRRLDRLAEPDAAAVSGPLAQIEGAAARMVHLIAELVDVTRLQMGQALSLERRPTDLVALARTIVEGQGGAEGRRLRLEATTSTLIAAVDPDRLERVIANLVANALAYSPQGGNVEVRVAREETPEGPCAVIAVSDQGIGIPAADLPYIFERFRRGGNVVGRIAGTGIGLASAQGIVEEHGGTIAVESQEGVGSTFTVRLPLDDVGA